MRLRTKLVAGTLALVPLLALGISSLTQSYSTDSEQSASLSLRSMASIDVAPDSAPQNQFGFAEAPEQPSLNLPAMLRQEPAREAARDAAAAASEAAAAASEAAAGSAPSRSSGIPPSALIPGLPKIAYTYGYGYRIGADQISDLQRRHADLCERQGPRVCRILSLQQSGEEGDYARATLELAVASGQARSFGGQLAALVKSVGGKEITTSISGEDLSKQIVDTEARLRARTLLRDRLMDVLANRTGKVAELVEAERGVAEVNEEIDEARSWLNEMRGRVEFSRVAIGYSAAMPTQGGFASPIRSVLGSVGAILGMTLAVLIALAAIGGPIGAVSWGVWKLWQRRRRPEADAFEPVTA